MNSKFRGKRVDNGEWVYGSLVYIKDQSHKSDRLSREVISSVDVCQIYSRGISEMMMGTPKNDPLRYKRDITVYDVIPESVGLFLLSKDEDGIDEYEGDIVETDTECVGVWTMSHHNLHRKIKWHKYLTDSYSTRRVIGNTTDNPELLKGNSNEQ